MPAHAAILHARSISLALTPFLASHRPMRVLSVHHRALNLIDETGQIVSIVTPNLGDGPFHIVLAQPTAFDATPPGATGQWLTACLQVGRWRVILNQAQKWDPLLPQTESLTRNVISETLKDCVTASAVFRKRWMMMDAKTVQRLQKGAAALRQGIAEQNAQTLRRGTALLAGLGPGLTPAGDDYLLGIMARLRLDNSLPDAEALTQEIINAAASVTTRLSRTWLAHAARGQFDARWHHLRNALMVSSDQKALCRAATDILSVGASSGAMAMAGFLLV